MGLGLSIPWRSIQRDLQWQDRVLDSSSQGVVMRRTIQFLLLAAVVLSAADDASAQRGGGGGIRFAGGGHGFSRGRIFSPFGFGYANLPPDAEYGYAPQPVYFVQPPPVFVQPPAPPVVARPVHPVVTEYKWPAVGATSSPSPSASESEPQTFAIVLKDGSNLSAVAVFASDDGLHYVDPDARHLRISMSRVDRAATLKVNSARNLSLYLPAAQ